jgi:branched-chain amino acid aminotransferase
LNTHPLDGTILPGIVRDSVIKLTKKYFPEILVREKPTHKDDLVSLYENGLLEEVFVTGTASTIGQVSELQIGDINIQLQENELGLGEELKNIIWQIQYGEKDHPYSVIIS